MSFTADASSAEQALLQTFGAENAVMVCCLADDLAARYGAGAEGNAARNVTFRAILSYNPAAEDELLHAARLVSLSMTQLDLLSGAADPEIPAEAKAKLAETAMRLERTIIQSQKCLMQRQRERQVEQGLAAHPANVGRAQPVAPDQTAPAKTPIDTSGVKPPAAPPVQPAPPPRPQAPNPSAPPRSLPPQQTAAHYVRPAELPAWNDCQTGLAGVLAQVAVAAQPSGWKANGVLASAG